MWRDDEANWVDIEGEGSQDEDEFEMQSKKGLKIVTRADISGMLNFAMSTNFMVDAYCNIDLKKYYRNLIIKGMAPELSILKKVPHQTGNLLSSNLTRWSTRLLKNALQTSQEK